MLTTNEKVKSNFESSAEKFDRIYDPSEKKSIFSRWLDKRLRKSMYFRFEETLKNIDDEKIQCILDVGCGSGRYCVEYLKMGKKVVGIDMAANMLKIAKETCFEAVPEGNIEFINGNYMKLDGKNMSIKESGWFENGKRVEYMKEEGFFFIKVCLPVIPFLFSFSKRFKADSIA